MGGLRATFSRLEFMRPGRMSNEELAAEIVRLNDELNDRCSELLHLREKLTDQHSETFEWGRKSGYDAGYKAGWNAASTNTEWNVE